MRIIEKYDDPHKLTIEGRGEGFKNFLEILKYMKHSGNSGHSFIIVADPDVKEKVDCLWDGDGSDYIEKIIFDEKEIK